MNKIRSLVTVSCALSLGAVVYSCGSFSSNPPGSGGNGGSGSPTGNGGSSGDQTGSGGSGSPTGSGGSGNPTGSGGSGNPTGNGGSGNPTGSGGSGNPTGSGGATGNGGATGTGGAAGTGGAPAGGAPCDILNAAGNTCVAAHSTVRALYANYTGPLYQVCKGSFRISQPPQFPACTGTTQNIGVVAGGYADFMAQDTFCAGASCTIFVIYDQSPNKNDLWPSPAGGNGRANNPVSATALSTKINGHTVYGVSIQTGTGYRAGCTNCVVGTPKGTATGDAAETEYMVTSQNNKQRGDIEGCCFDYGNAETNSNDDGNGTMEAVYFGGGVAWGTGSPGGHTNGPWVMADLENGLYAGWVVGPPATDQNISSNIRLPFNFVTGMVVGDTRDKNSGRGRFAIYGSDATTGNLTTLYDGVRPTKTGYVPMAKQGSIILGTGGDNSNAGTGNWFEGVMATGAATLQTLNAVQANIVAAKYGK